MDKGEVKYFKAILPLRLEWEPCYFTTTELPFQVGDRVRVPLAGKVYTGVVSETGVTPEVAVNKVQQVIGKADNLDPIQACELKFWKFVAEYYLCTLGEVYKAAYPVGRQAVESKKPKLTLPQGGEVRRHPLSAGEKEMVRQVIGQFDAGLNSVVLKAGKRVGVYCELIRRTLDEGRAVLVLAPAKDVVAALQQELGQWFPDLVVGCSGGDSPAVLRETGRLLRSGEPRIVVGTRQSVFLPFSNLGLIIVDQEQDPFFKQNSPSPRYNARDAALALASIQKARVLLGTASPSLETELNVRTGKFGCVCQPIEEQMPVPNLVDTAEEARKNGMDGSFSKVLVKRCLDVMGQKGKVLLLVPWKDTSDLEIEWRERFPLIKAKIESMSYVRGRDLRKYDLVGLLCADYIAQKDDFRGDEKVSRAISSLLERCSPGTLLIQTRNAEGAPFTASMDDMLSQRREFGFPPFTRMIDICISDANESRLSLMSRMLQTRLSSLLGRWDSVKVDYLPGVVRVLLPKDKRLNERKKALMGIISSFETERKYSGHIYVDVDPQ